MPLKSSDRSDPQFLLNDPVNNHIHNKQQQSQIQIQQYDQFSTSAPLTNTTAFNPNYYQNAYYHRFIPSPAPFYLAGYTDANGFMEIGDGMGGNNMMMVGNFGVASTGQEESSPSTNAALLYDPIYGQQYAAYSFLPPHQGYFDNNYPIGYTTTAPNSVFEEHQQQFHQHFRMNYQNSSGDVFTPYPSELGSNDNICGGSSSGGTGSSSPAPKESYCNNDFSGTTTSMLSSNHVRPLDVITPELFQAIHAPTFYKSVINPQQHQIQTTNALPISQPFFFPFSESLSGPSSVYGNGIYSASTSSAVNNSASSNHQMSYIPPINSISSMASYQPLKTNNLGFPSNQFGPFLSSTQQPQKLLNPTSNTRTSVSGNGNGNPVYTSSGNNKDILPTVTGPDGQIYQKPPGSYASLITKALKESESGKMTLSGIYQWIKNNYPYYRSAEAAWQNSIRHNLSLNKCFKKVARPADEPGKGGFWALDYDYIRNQEMTKRINNQHSLTTDLENWGNDSEPIESRYRIPSTETTKESTKPLTTNNSSKKKRNTADLEASKLLDMIIPGEGWEDSVRAVASVVDEIYASNFEQEALENYGHKSTEDYVKEKENKPNNQDRRNKCSKKAKRTSATASKNITSPVLSDRLREPNNRLREPKPYTSMSTTIKIPTPILPNALSGPTSGTASASRQLHYHQYQPATPLSSGTSSAK